MKETSRETLARAEFWAMQAMNQYGYDDERHEIMRQAYELVRLAAEKEEQVAQHRALMAIQQA